VCSSSLTGAIAGVSKLGVDAAEADGCGVVLADDSATPNDSAAILAELLPLGEATERTRDIFSSPIVVAAGAVVVAPLPPTDAAHVAVLATAAACHPSPFSFGS
jgi:hypothetical protein